MRGPRAFRWKNHAEDPMNSERRKNDRLESLHLLDFVVVDEFGQHGDYTMGRTLNVSRGGILMESHLEMKEGQQVVISMELQDTLLHVMGKIVDASFANPRYRYGIEFYEVPEADQRVLDSYVDAFHALETQATEERKQVVA